MNACGYGQQWLNDVRRYYKRKPMCRPNWRETCATVAHHIPRHGYRHGYCKRPDTRCAP